MNGDKAALEWARNPTGDLFAWKGTLYKKMLKMPLIKLGPLDDLKVSLEPELAGKIRIGDPNQD